MKWVWRILGIVLIAAMTAAALPGLPHGAATAQWAAEMVQRAKAAPLWLWVSVFVGWTLTYALRAERLYQEWHPRCGISRSQALRVLCRHLALLHVVPMRGGELAFPWLMHREHGVKLTSALTSLMVWRLQDAILLGLLIFVGMLHGVAGLAAWLVLPLAMVVLPALFAWTTHRVRRWLSVAWMDADQPLVTSANAWWLGLANWMVKVSVIGLALSILVPLSWAMAVAGALGGELGAAQPLQPLGGFGTYELAVWAGVLASPQPTLSGQALPVLLAALVVHAVLLCGALAVGALAVGLPSPRVAESPRSAP